MSQTLKQTADQQVTIQNSMLLYLLLQLRPLAAAMEPQHGFFWLMHLYFDNTALYSKKLLLHLLFNGAKKTLTISGTKENQVANKKSASAKLLASVHVWG